MNETHGYQYYREVGDGRFVGIMPKIFTCAIVIGDISEIEHSYTENWCFTTKLRAIAALEDWDPLTQKEPMGWCRHPMSGRRRPDGDPSKEYINF